MTLDTIVPDPVPQWVPAGTVRGPEGPQGKEGPPGAPSTIPGPPGDPTEFERRGAGFPEGVVAAPPGTYYTDTAMTNGAARWVKRTGTGRTGWEVVVGDTGWRNVTAELMNNVTAYLPSNEDYQPHVRRIDNVVYWRGPITVPSLASGLRVGDQIWAIPSGFRNVAAGPIASGGWASSQSPAGCNVQLMSANGVGGVPFRFVYLLHASFPAPITTFYVDAVWMTFPDLWPAILPGTQPV